MPLTAQVTEVLVELATVAENGRVPPSNTLPEVGVTVTLTVGVGGGGGGAVELPPPPPQAVRERTAAKKISRLTELARKAACFFYKSRQRASGSAAWRSDHCAAREESLGVLRCVERRGCGVIEKNEWAYACVGNSVPKCRGAFRFERWFLCCVPELETLPCAD